MTLKDMTIGTKMARSSGRTVILALGLAVGLVLDSALTGTVISRANAQEPNPALRSLVAGYKAAFTCSAYFNAGRTVDQIAGDELNRIYRDYRAIMADLPAASIDDDKKTVSVTYAENSPPRISAWRPSLGCTQLPTGADPASVSVLPALSAGAGDDQSSVLPDTLPTALSNDPALGGIVAAAFDRETYGAGTETTAVLVVKNGAIIAERYRDGFGPDTPQRTWSVAKSIAASIVGVAVRDGLIDPDAPAGLAAWQSPGDPRGAITLDDLLRMASGLTSPTAGNRTDDIYFGGGRVVDHAVTNRLVRTPGTHWRYANNDTMAAMRALRERMNDDAAFLRFPFEQLLGPLGMDHTFLETDWNGDFILSSQVWTTARDLARLGLLYLGEGVLDGQRLLPEGWANYVATPNGPQPPARRSGDVPPGYGAQFWLYGEPHGLPEGTYAARGNRGQYLVIIPAADTLIVRRGFDDGGGFDLTGFTADILSAVDHVSQ